MVTVAMHLCLFPQEDGKVKCFRYFPPDEQEQDKPNYVQFEQVHNVG